MPARPAGSGGPGPRSTPRTGSRPRRRPGGCASDQALLMVSLASWARDWSSARTSGASPVLSSAVGARATSSSISRSGYIADKFPYQQFNLSRSESPVGEWCLVLHFAHPSPEVGECGICRWLWRSAPGRQCGPTPPHGVRQELQGRQRPVVPTATTQMPNTGHNDYQEPRTKLQTRGR